MLHTYLEFFYRGLKEGLSPNMANKHGLAELDKEWTEKAKNLSDTAMAASEEEIALEIAALPEKAARIAARYYTARGKADAEQYEVLLVEERGDTPLMTTEAGDVVVAPFVIDLVVRDRETEIVEIWDHKSTREPPKEEIRLRDFQLLLYSVALHERFGLTAERLVWNYLRTKEPSEVKLVNVGKKNESLSRSTVLDTTETIYRAAIKAHKLKVKDYKEELARLAGRETDKFFPRTRQELVQSEAIVLGDFVRTAEDIVNAHKQYEFNGEARTVRNLGNPCEWCAYKRLCTAVIVGDDTGEMEDRLFARRGGVKPVELPVVTW